MKRYKLVRIVDGEFHSANTPWEPLTYTIGEVTSAPNLGIACYKTLEYADRPNHIRETQLSFNDGNPIAILEVKSIGRHIPKPDPYRYCRGGCYEGGVNYSSVRVIKVVKKIKGVRKWQRLEI